MPKFVYDFIEGNKDLKDLLGGKGANLAEMTNLGLPVPPGFTITTDACRYYLEHGGVPDGLDDEVSSHLHALEESMGRKLGAPADPLLVSVRSGAKFSMPGMMDTVLNIGLSDESVGGLLGQRRRRVGQHLPAEPDAPVRGRGRVRAFDRRQQESKQVLVQLVGSDHALTLSLPPIVANSGMILTSMSGPARERS